MRVKHGRYTDGYSSAHMDRLFEMYAQQYAARNAPLLLHFHGGLVDSAHAAARAERLARAYAPSGAFPVFYIWHAGVEETLASMPLGASLGAAAQLEWLAHGPVLAVLGDLNRNRQIHRAVRDRERNGTDHGEVTAQEELLRRVGNPATMAFWRTLNENVDRSFERASDAGVYQLQLHLARFCNSAKPPRVLLVGHSMGAIHALRFAASWREVAGSGTAASALRFDVILLGPATGFDSAMAAVRSGTVQNLRIFGLGDEYERADAISRWYDRSLLYFVSGVLEPYADFPLVGMQRFWTGSSASTRTYTSDLQKRFADPLAVWSPASCAPDACNGARTHSELDDDPLVITSINALTLRGWADGRRDLPSG